MAEKLMGIEVKGKRKTWGFAFYADDNLLAEWQADGLEIGIIENVIPGWVGDLGLARIWCFFQDAWNFKNPFRK